MPANIWLAIITGVVVLGVLAFVRFRRPGQEGETRVEFLGAKVEHKDASPPETDDISIDAGRDADLTHQGPTKLKAKVKAKQDAKVEVRKS